MNTNDFAEFHSLWLNAHAMSSSNQIPSDTVVMAVFDVLASYPLPMIRAALGRHSRQSRFAPTPADVVELLDVGKKRLSADEAWAMAPSDETETVVWTAEMAQAYSIAYDLIVEGDHIAARMAFRGAYERLCAEAQAQNRPPRWQVSLGHDKAKVAPALERAVAQGRISQAEAARHLPPPMDGGVIGKLLAGKVVAGADLEKNKATVARMREILADIDKNQQQKQRDAVAKKTLKTEASEQKREQALAVCDSK